MKICTNEWSRRKFITAVTGFGGTIMLHPISSWTNFETAPRVAEIVARTIGIDTHNHIDVPLNTTETPAPKVDLDGDMKKSGLSAVCMTFAVDYQKLTKTGEAYERFINGLNAMDEILKSNKMQRALNSADIKAAHKKHKPTSIQSVESSHFLEGHLAFVNLNTAAGRNYQPIEQEREAFSGIIVALSGAQKDSARLTSTFSDILLGPGRDGKFPDTKQGVRIGNLNSTQQKQVMKSIGLYVNDLDAATAKSVITKYTAELIGAVNNAGSSNTCS